MSIERRRYFRIDEAIGVHYSVIDSQGQERAQVEKDVLALVSEHDKKIERLLLELADELPKVSELIAIFNQKIERIISQIAVDSQLVNRIAYKVREVNISACGMAFINDEALDEGTRLYIELQLLPSQKKVRTDGILVSCEQLDEDEHYWRIDFYNMGESAQEELIQHIVKRQSVQLKTRQD